MIEKVNIIKLASFKDYNQEFNFQKINVFFGYNGCGKTTLSRIVNCLEKNEIIEELETEDDCLLEFSIKIDNQTFSEKNLSNDLKIKVFNQDYVNKNINYDSLSGILIAGEESKEKQEKVIKLTDKKENLKSQLSSQKDKENNLKRRIEDLKLKIENQKSQVAKFIKDKLKGFDNSYDRRKLDEFKSDLNFENYKNQVIDLENEILNYNSPNKQNINILQPLREITENEVKNINNILESSVLDSVKIPEITADFEKWASNGLKLHENNNSCVFCGSSLTQERKNKLNSHFSTEYKNLIIKIDNKIKEVEELKNSNINTYFDWYDEFRGNGEKQRNVLNKKIEIYNNYLDKIITILKKKKGDAFNADFSFNWFGEFRKEENKKEENISNDTIKTYNNYFHEIIEILKKTKKSVFDVGYEDCNLDISSLNNLIKEHRKRRQNFEKFREESANKVIAYKILEMEKSVDFIDKQTGIKTKNEELKDLDKVVDTINSEISTTQLEIDNISKEIHELSIGAEKFNQYLDELLPSIGLMVKPNGNNFSLKRDGFQLKHLSDGERNALSFIYFVLSFSDRKEKKNKLKDDLKGWVVFIDDPISSLDDSNMHLVAGFIKKHFRYTKQLFITTHNFGFWRCFRNNKQDSGYSHYLIEKKKGNSIILELEKEHVLVRHQSDYTFIYLKLSEFISNSESEDNVTILNHLRKFLEHFASFMYPNDAGVDKILETLLNDEYKLSSDIESYIVYQSSNEGSHMQTRTDFISKNSDDIKKNIEQVINAIKSKYPEHIDSLENNQT